MKEDVKLADEMIRDPFETPLSFQNNGGKTVVDLLLKEMFPGEAHEWKDQVLVTTPSDLPKGIIDAKASSTCEYCENSVWISPSSARILSEANVVCTRCLAKILVEAQKRSE